MTWPSASVVRAIIEDPLAGNRRWTLQGFGMLRLYLDPDEVGRLHIWDTHLAVEDVSTVHDHPWDLDSRIISGTLLNQRYLRVGALVSASGAPLKYEEWQAVQIRTGEGGHVLAPPALCHLAAQDIESYYPGQSYHQDAEEIHESLPVPGTVTTVMRTFSRQRDIATSCYRGDAWVSAEPRLATPDEVLHFTTLALEKWDG